MSSLTNYYPIILSQNNVDSSQNNKLVYNFPAGSVGFTDTSKIAIKSIKLFYSWYNITSSIGNNVFHVYFPDTVTPVDLDITIPDGYYSIADLNSYLQSWMIAHNVYLVDSAGDYVYYMRFEENSTYYAVQLICYAIPNSLPSGWTNPGSWNLPAAAETPICTILNNGFATLIGFAAGSFPTVAQSTDYTVLSTSTPQVNPSTSILVSCNVCDNKRNLNGNILSVFTQSGVGFGGLIDYSPNEFSWITCSKGQFQNLEITLLDENYNNLAIRDTQMVMEILISE